MVKAFHKIWLYVIVLFSVVCAPVFATVSIGSFTPSVTSPQPIGKTITWTATATDTGAGPLTFQFNVAPPHGALALVKDFNVGTLSGGTWTARPFIWVPTGVEGTFEVQVVIKDFGTGQTTSTTASYVVNPIVTGSNPVVESTANPLVALFSAPSCTAGSTMRVVFHKKIGPLSNTNWVPCHPPATMTFEVAGMVPSATYTMYAETETGGQTTNGPQVTFTTGSLPTTIPFPTFNKLVSPASSSIPYPVILHSLFQTGTATVFAQVATNLSGNIIWYYYNNHPGRNSLLTRPLPGGGMLIRESDVAWNPTITEGQILRQIDLAGNIVRETNIGVLQQELKAKGSAAGGACPALPAPPGTACIGDFHHDAIQTLPNGYTAVLVSEEKLFKAGTQGDTSGLLVDIVGDMILVLDNNWQLVWYWDAFNPQGGGNGYPELPVTRTALLGETCYLHDPNCPPMFLLGSGVATYAHDWLHANSLYYWPAPQDGNAAGGDIVWSSRHQDSIFKIDYKDGSGTGDILWRLGNGGDFQFVNLHNDPWPWFSHQHEVGIENNGAGPMTLFDNGNTRITDLGSGCPPYDCNSRGMALTVNQTTMTVTPVLSLDLGHYSSAEGSAQLLPNGNYFFENGFVQINSNSVGYSLGYGPTPAFPQLGTPALHWDLSGPEHYRAFQMANMYQPPRT